MAPPHAHKAWGSRGERIRVAGLVACCNYLSKKKKKMYPQNNDDVPTKVLTSSIRGPISKYLHASCLSSSNINVYTVHLTLKTLKCKIKICTLLNLINLPTIYNRKNKLVLVVTKLWSFRNCQLLTKARRHLQLHKVGIGS